MLNTRSKGIDLEIKNRWVGLPPGELESSKKNSDPSPNSIGEKEGLAEVANSMGHARLIRMVALRVRVASIPVRMVPLQLLDRLPEPLFRLPEPPLRHCPVAGGWRDRREWRHRRRSPRLSPISISLRDEAGEFRETTRGPKNEGFFPGPRLKARSGAVFLRTSEWLRWSSKRACHTRGSRFLWRRRTAGPLPWFGLGDPVDHLIVLVGPFYSQWFVATCYKDHTKEIFGTHIHIMTSCPIFFISFH